MNILAALTNPKSFFKQQAEQELRWTFVLMQVAGIVFVIFLALVLLYQLFADSPLSEFPFIPLLLVVPCLLIVWAFYGGVILLFAGEGSRAGELAGWFLLPQVVMFFVMLPLIFVIMSFGPLVDSLLSLLPDIWESQVRVQVAQNFIKYLWGGLSFCSTLWGLWILHAGLRVFAPGRVALTSGLVAALSLGPIAAWPLIRSWDLVQNLLGSATEMLIQSLD